jgi:X-Pro dipeptidyl-peptidase
MQGKLWLAVALVAALAAGCVTPGVVGPASSTGKRAFEPLTEATHKLGKTLSLQVKSYDGTPIHIDLQLPDGNGPFPTILEDTPYSLLGQEESGAETDLGLPAQLASEYVSYGYAYGVVHVRGTGESGGCLDIGGPEEGKDGYAMVEWVANQSWSNGKVAMMGTSYVGTTPLETAVLSPPHLAAIVPMSGVTEWYKYYFENGLHRRNGDPFPGSSDTDPVLWTALGVAPGVRTQTTGGVDDVRCPAQYTLEDYGQDDYDAYWHQRDITKDAANVTTAVLYAHGFEDGNVAPSVVPPFLANLTHAKDLHVWLQQHGHGVPSSKKSFYAYAHRFLDHYLLGKENGAELLPRVIVEDNLHKYRAETAWPPANATATVISLGADGKLVLGNATAAKAGSLSYADDGTGSIDPKLDGVDHLTFASDALAAPLHLAGVPRIHLTASTATPDLQLDVLLYDQAPGGAQTLVTRGFLDGRHRASLDHGTDVPTNTPTAFEWILHPNDHRVDAGHKLVLYVKSTDDYVVRSPYRSSVTLSLGADKAWLDLPVVGDAGLAYADDAPAPWS